MKGKKTAATFKGMHGPKDIPNQLFIIRILL